MSQQPTFNPISGFSPRAVARYRRLIAGKRLRVYGALTFGGVAGIIAVSVAVILMGNATPLIWLPVNLAVAAVTFWFSLKLMRIWPRKYVDSPVELPDAMYFQAMRLGVSLPDGKVMLETHENHCLVSAFFGFRTRCVLAWDGQNFIDVDSLMAKS